MRLSLGFFAHMSCMKSHFIHTGIPSAFFPQFNPHLIAAVIHKFADSFLRDTNILWITFGSLVTLGGSLRYCFLR